MQALFIVFYKKYIRYKKYEISRHFHRKIKNKLKNVLTLKPCVYIIKTNELQAKTETKISMLTSESRCMVRTGIKRYNDHS